MLEGYVQNRKSEVRIGVFPVDNPQLSQVFPRKNRQSEKGSETTIVMADLKEDDLCNEAGGQGCQQANDDLGAPLCPLQDGRVTQLPVLHLQEGESSSRGDESLTMS